jgi:Reverse transcriptase (RNA-dependent DNA polymerase)
MEQKDLYMIFINLEKRNVKDLYIKYQEMLYGGRLKRKKFQQSMLTFIKDMYTNVVTNVRICDDESNVFSIKIELHEGSALSPYIFTLVIDEVMKNIQEGMPRCIQFVDDVVLIDKNKIRVDQN